ncbi:ribonuclease BN [Oceanococcus atlanticus]|uniref:Ribonuclease BN n=1 Tax=Oceanococcus atlanticus TaxID=1317117 RepID=A0A1Y1SBC4_9GAMM|nr:YihY/virulence factor BrkB family protein [Oceanococcus atlanticus]ORE85200.1 ribonuclease BN [Oceanococcus atlanticus]
MNIKEYWDGRLNLLWTYSAQGWRRQALQAGRLVFCTIRELTAGELTLRAMSLVYTTLLSLVPLLALAFSIMKGLGVHNRVEPMIAALLEPLGPSAGEITTTVIGFVDNIKIGVLGSIGIALLFYTVLAMIQKVESAFNFIWKIPRQRPLTQRISEYLVVLLLGPLAITLVIGTTASLSSNRLVENLLSSELVSQSVYLAGLLLPYVVIVSIFTFVFMFIPNTRVRLLPAFVGGLVSGLLWQSAAWGFANFVAGSSGYNAIYSSFAILILLLIWLYLGWLILLTGCQIAFFLQHPEYLTRVRRHAEASGATRDMLILTLLGLVQARFSDAQSGLNPAELARRSGAPPDLVNPMINNLLACGLLAETADGALLPRVDMGRMALAELLNRVDARSVVHRQGGGVHERARDLAEQLAQARTAVLGELTLNEWLETGN